nr:hypothetical protein [Tanacetum cinerariifolium]
MLQKLVSQLEIHEVSLSKEDVNLKFLLSTTTHNLAFMSSSHTDSPTESVSAAASVSVVYAKMYVSSLLNIDSLSNASYQAEEEPTNYALLAFSFLSSSSDNELSPTKPEQDLSHTSRPTTPIIEDWVSDSEDESETKAPQIVLSFVEYTEQVKSPTNSVQHVNMYILAATPKPASLKPTSSGKRRNRKACFVSKSVDHLIKDCNYYANKIAQPTPRNHAHSGNHKQYAPLTHINPQKHMVPTAVLTQSKPVSITAVRPVSAAVPKIKVARPRHVNPIVTKTDLPIRRHITRSPSPKTSNSPPRVTAVTVSVVSVAQVLKGKWEWRPKYPILDHLSRTTSASMTLKRFDYNDALGTSKSGNPQHALKDKGVIDSRCSRHMTGNMSYVSDFEELNGGYVAFGGNPKGGKIFGKGKIRTDFKLLDESQVLLRVPDMC